jgi:hypothetical protein
MPHSNQDSHGSSNVVGIGATEAHAIMADIRQLRQRVLVAWNERAVVLTKEEQRELKAEITHTCELLTLLTSRD